METKPRGRLGSVLGGNRVQQPAVLTSGVAAAEPSHLPPSPLPPQPPTQTPASTLEAKLDLLIEQNKTISTSLKQVHLDLTKTMSVLMVISMLSAGKNYEGHLSKIAEGLGELKMLVMRSAPSAFPPTPDSTTEEPVTIRDTSPLITFDDV